MRRAAALTYGDRTLPAHSDDNHHGLEGSQERL